MRWQVAGCAGGSMTDSQTDGWELADYILPAYWCQKEWLKGGIAGDWLVPNWPTWRHDSRRRSPNDWRVCLLNSWIKSDLRISDYINDRFFILVPWHWVRLSPLGSSATNWSIAPALDDRWVWQLPGETEVMRKLSPVPLRPPHTPHDLILDRTRVVEVGRLTVWTITQPRKTFLWMCRRKYNLEILWLLMIWLRPISRTGLN
jgi:hypothetical protein